MKIQGIERDTTIFARENFPKTKQNTHVVMEKAYRKLNVHRLAHPVVNIFHCFETIKFKNILPTS